MATTAPWSLAQHVESLRLITSHLPRNHRDKGDKYFLSRLSQIQPDSEVNTIMLLRCLYSNYNRGGSPYRQSMISVESTMLQSISRMLHVDFHASTHVVNLSVTT